MTIQTSKLVMIYKYWKHQRTKLEFKIIVKDMHITKFNK